MVLSFTRFSYTVHPSGIIGTDGNVYLTVIGAERQLVDLCPALAVAPRSVGAVGSDPLIGYGQIIHALGAVLRYGPDIIDTIIVNVLITDGQLTTILAPLLEYARDHGLVYELRPSQLRAHLGRIATLLTAEDASAADALTVTDSGLLDLTAMFAAIEAAAAPPTGAGGPPPPPARPWAVPEAAIHLTFGMVPPEAIGVFECAVGARVASSEREAGGSVAVVFEMVLQAAFSALAAPGGVRSRGGSSSAPFALPSWVTPQMAAREFGLKLALAMPPEPAVVMPLSLAAARMALAEALATEQHDLLSVSNILAAVDHHPPLITILGGNKFCSVDSAAAWAGVRTLVSKCGVRGSSLVVGDLAILSPKLKHAASALSAPSDQALTCEARVARAIELIDERDAEAKRGKSESVDQAKLVGYPQSYQAVVYAKLADPSFMALVDTLNKMFDDGKHPHDIIAAIILSGEAIFYHALCGVKDEVASVPLVKKIADELRMHGETFMGQLGYELTMPRSIVAMGPPDAYPRIPSLWKTFISGSVLFDLENLVLYGVPAFYMQKGDERKTIISIEDSLPTQVLVPTAEVYGSTVRLRQLLSRIGRDKTGFFAQLNFTGSESFESALHGALDYHQEASLVPDATRNLNIHDYLWGVLTETSTLRMRAMKKGDPGFVFGGNLICPNSQADLAFSEVRGKVGKTASSAASLIDLGLGHLLPASLITPPDLRGASGGTAGGGGNGGDGKTPGGGGAGAKDGGGDGGAGADAAAAAAAAAKAKKKEEAAAALAAKHQAIEIGARKDLVEVTETLLKFPLPNEKVAAYPKKEFYETAGVPADACMACWCSTFGAPWAYCQEAGQPRHTSKTKGAHAVPTWWRGRYLKTLLVLGMAQLGDAFTMGAAWASAAGGAGARASLGAWAGMAPAVSGVVPGSAPSAPFDASFAASLAPHAPCNWYVGELAPSLYVSDDHLGWNVGATPFVPSMAPPMLTAPTLSAPPLSALPPLARGEQHAQPPASDAKTLTRPHVRTAPSRDPLPQARSKRVPTIDVTSVGTTGAHVFLPLILTQGAPWLGVAGGASHSLFGYARRRDATVSRERDHADAQQWAKLLLPGRPDVYAFYLFELEKPPIVVSGALVSNPPPDGWEAASVASTAALAAAPLRALCWAQLSSLRAHPILHHLAALASARADGFREPTVGLPDNVKTGAMEEAMLEPRQILVAAKATRVPWRSVVRKAEDAMSVLRSTLEARIEGAATQGQADDIRGWLAAAGPLSLNEIHHALRDECYTATDPRLAHIPMPYVPSVATAPLAPLGEPPPCHLVPPTARDWDDAMRPDAYEALCRCQEATHLHLLHIAKHGSADASPIARKDMFFACGPDSLYPWAEKLVLARHVIVREGGRLTLRDLSRTPEFTLCPVYAAKLLGKSPDAALRDACTTHGCDFFTKLAPQLVWFPPMKSVEDGFVSIHTTLRKMLGSAHGWFRRGAERALHAPRLILISWPGRYASVGAVARNYSDEYRMIVNDTYGDGLFTTVGVRAPIVSVNSSTGAQFDRAIRKLEDEERDAPQAPCEPIEARSSAPTPTAAESPTDGRVAVHGKFGVRPRARRREAPAVFSAQAISARRPYAPPLALPGSAPGATILPPEIKPFLYNMMVVIVLLTHPAELLGLVVFLSGDDYSKFFHQLTLSYRQRHFAQMAMLDPETLTEQLMTSLASAILASLDKQLLVLIEACCVSMGTTPSSSWAQRYLTEFCNHYQEKFHRAHLDLYAEWARREPKFAKWTAARRRLAGETHRTEDYCLVTLSYTDDPLTACIGEVLMADHTEMWGPECDESKLIRGVACKRTMGVRAGWIGGQFFTVGLLCFMTEQKVARAAMGVARAAAGELTILEMRGLGGLLQHFVFSLIMERHIMYNFYDGVDRLKRLHAAAGAGRAGNAKALWLFGGPDDPTPEGVVSLGKACDLDVVNYDIENGLQFDLSSVLIQETILRAIFARTYACVTAAPLCRSYSARHVPCLRSPEEPRGRTPIPRAWAAYLRHDTGLALFAVRVCHVSADAGLVWLLEQPSPRDDKTTHAYWPQYADVGTLWHDSDTRALMAHPTAAYFDFAQCNVGSLFQKYTRVAGHRVYLTSLAPRLHAGEKCICPRHAKVASGVDADGAYNSRASAYYPLPMKQAMIATAARTVRLLAVEGDRMGARQHMPNLPATTLVPVTRRSRRAFEGWASALGQRSGSSMLGAIFQSRPPRGAVRFRMHSDAAIKGTSEPGITSNLYGHYCTVSLLGSGWLRMPIVALEFLGQAPLGLMAFGHLVPTTASALGLPGDSLVVPTVIASRVRNSRLLAFMHAQWLALPVVQRLLPILYMSHEYGVGNPICDLGSRGSQQLMLSVMRHLHLDPQAVAVPPEFIEFGDAALAFYDSLDAEQRAVEDHLLSGGGAINCEPCVAGPRPPPPSPPPSPPPTVCALAAPQPLVMQDDGRRAEVHTLSICTRAHRWAMGAVSRCLSPFERACGSAFSCDVAGDGAPSPSPLLRPASPAGARRPAPTPARLTGGTSLGARGRVDATTPRRPAPTAAASAGAPGAGARMAPMLLTIAAVHATPTLPEDRRPVAGSPPSTLTAPATTYGRHGRVDGPAPAVTTGGLAWWRPRPTAVPGTAIAAAALRSGWESALLADTSELAIMPGRPEELAGTLEELREVLDAAYASSTNSTDKYHLEAWRKACAELGTPMWRTDAAANSGLDPVGHRREIILPALALLRMYAKMSPRSKKDPAANPRSAIAKLYAVAREHNKRGYKMAPFTVAIQVVKGLLRRYVELHGTDSLAPARKNPLTNELIMGMLGAPVDWTLHYWIAVRATFEVLAETGMRKADVSRATKATPFRKGRLTYASLTWSLGGKRTATPTLAELRAIDERSGDGCWLVYGALKNDAYGEFFGSKPSWLPYSSLAPRNACRALAALEVSSALGGLTPAARAATPLFGPEVGTEWHHDLLDSIFVWLLREGAKLSEQECKAYSVHSFRIFLACALYAAGCPTERIMAILRWKSEEALLIYARLNDGERASWVAKSMSTLVDSTVAAHLPHMDADAWVASLQSSLDSGALDAAARDAQRGLDAGADAMPDPASAGPPPPHARGAPAQARPASVAPSVLVNGDRLRVYWTDEAAWYEGTFTSSRVVERHGGGLARESRVYYDAVGVWKAQGSWHLLDDELWERLPTAAAPVALR